MDQVGWSGLLGQVALNLFFLFFLLKLMFFFRINFFISKLIHIFFLFRETLLKENYSFLVIIYAFNF
jgi:hypothetical protein